MCGAFKTDTLITQSFIVLVFVYKLCFCTDPSDQIHLESLIVNIISSMDVMVMDEEDDCPELVPIDTPSAPSAEQIPVTIITGYLGERSALLTALMGLYRGLYSYTSVCLQ